MKRIFFILLVLTFSRMAVAQSGGIYGEVLESKRLQTQDHAHQKAPDDKVVGCPMPEPGKKKSNN